MKHVVVLGAGGLAREIAEYLEAVGDEIRVLGFVDADRSRKGEIVNGLPIIGALEDLGPVSNVFAVAGAGTIGPRRSQIAEIERAGLVPLSVVHPGAVVQPSVSLADGCVIAPAAVVSSNATLGAHVLVNYGATVGHDVVTGACCVIGPGCHISGWVRMGEDCYFGAGAVVLPGLSIGDGAIIGAGAVVTKDVEPGVTVVGVPAAPVVGGNGGVG